MKRHACQARQYGDQMICAPCGLNWDVNDPEPPECRKNIKRAIARVAKIEEEAAPPQVVAGHAPGRSGRRNGQDLPGKRPGGTQGTNCRHAGGLPFIFG